MPRRRAGYGASRYMRDGCFTPRETARRRTGRRSGRSASRTTAVSPPMRAGSRSSGAARPYAVSDIAFSQEGAMILAQRAPVAGATIIRPSRKPASRACCAIWLKGPNDPPSPGRWKPMPEEYAVGFAGNYRNTDGGVALGYGYDRTACSNRKACEAALWTTGQNLRNNPALRSQLEPGGPLVVNGLQGSPADMVRGANEPPSTSYFIDYDDKFDDARASGHMGSVRDSLRSPAPGRSRVLGPPRPLGSFFNDEHAGQLHRPELPHRLYSDLHLPSGYRAEGPGMRQDGYCPPPMVPGPVPGQCVCPPGHRAGRRGMRARPEDSDSNPLQRRR